MVYVDDFVEMFQPFDALVSGGLAPSMVQFAGDRRLKGVVDQGRFAGAGDAGDAGKKANWDYDIDGL